MDTQSEIKPTTNFFVEKLDDAVVAKQLEEETFEREESSCKGHTVNALVPTGDEGRAKLRKATVSCKGALTRGCPNGVT